MKQPNHEVVVITGASAGVGRATVREFARHGAKIGLLARGRAGLEGARRDVEELGSQAMVLPTDVADANQVEASAAAVEQELGPIDIWVNVAMASVLAEFKAMTPDEYRRVKEVTYLGQVHGTMAALKRMLPRDRGTIVQVGSALAYRGIPLQTAYCGAKHAIQGFTESLRAELLHDRSKVWITMVQMPALNTPQFGWCRSKMPRIPQPVPPIYQPEIAAEAVYFASHHRRREIYVGGSTAAVIVGNKIAPLAGDYYLAKTGFDSQQYDGAPAPDRPDNLFEPADQEHDFGAHGVFDDRAKEHSMELWLTKNKYWLALTLPSVVAMGVAVMAARLR